MLLKRPRLALVLVLLLSVLLGTYGVLRSRFDVQLAESVVDPNSDAARHEVEYESTFGSDPVVVLVDGDIPAIFQGQGLQQLIGIEANLTSDANHRRGLQYLYGPTTIATVAATAADAALLARVQKAESDAYQKAYSDAKAAGASDSDAAAKAQQAQLDAGKATLANAPKDFPEFQKIGIPSADNPAWVSAIFLDQNGKPKPRFSAVVPDSRHVLITGRLDYGTGEQSVNEIVQSVRDALRKNPLKGATVTVTGVPVLEAAVGKALRLALLVGMAAGIIAMALLLGLSLRRRAGVAARLLPLLGGLFTVAVLSGLLTLIDHVAVAIRGMVPIENGGLHSILVTLSVGLNPATLAAFPVALGLAVDYSVQFLYRHYQAATAGAEDALLEAQRGAGGATLRAAVCTAAGILALLTSGIPMVRQFGMVMILGVVVAWSVSRLTLLAGLALLGRRARTRRAAAAARRQAAGEDDVALFGLSGPTAAEALVTEQGSALTGLTAWVRTHTTHVLAPALLLALGGWIALPFATYETNPEKLVSPDLPAFKDLDRVRQVTGSSGELDFVLVGKDVTSAAAAKWVTDLSAVAAEQSNGQYRAEASLAQLFGAVNAGAALSPEQTTAYLSVMPAYFTEPLVNKDHTLARVALGIPLSSVADQEAALQRIINNVDAPPGYSYYPAGFSYLTIKGLENLEAGQLLLNILGAVFVLVALLLVYRRIRLALYAWVPTTLVAGWSTAVLFILRQPLTPMTAVLGALVVAFGTEFAVLWLERYREAVATGVPAGSAAVAVATRAAGPGIVVSGSALTLGFLALTIGGLPGVRSMGFDLPMVRDFGVIAAMDMVLAVVAALVVLPALVVRFGLPLAPATAAPPGEEPHPAPGRVPA